MDYCSILPQWLTAIGTVLAVFLALFQKTIRDWFYRPKIQMSYTNDKLCRAEYDSGVDNNSDSKVLKIRIKIENNGNSGASNVGLYVDCFYKLNANQEYVRNDITPQQMSDYRNTKPASIVPNLFYYFDIVSIKKYDSRTTQDERETAKQFYKVYLLGDRDALELGKGTFVIPLKFYSSSIVHKEYLKVFWDSDKYEITNEHLSIEMIAEKEFSQYKTKVN